MWKAIRASGLKAVDTHGRRHFVKDDENPSSMPTNDKAQGVDSRSVELATAGRQYGQMTSDPVAALDEQELDDNARKLFNYLSKLPGFEFATELDYGDYKHMGATITASILQAGLNWETTVKPRIDRLIAEFPKARTTTDFLTLLERDGHSRILGWSDDEKPNRILGVARFFQAHGVETEVKLREWLSSDGNADQLLGLRGVGNKTVDFFKILVRIQTNAVDRHLKALVADAGIAAKTYRECHAIINRAADLRVVDRVLLDFSIWKYKSKLKKGLARPRRQVCRKAPS